MMLCLLMTSLMKSVQISSQEPGLCSLTQEEALLSSETTSGKDTLPTTLQKLMSTETVTSERALRTPTWLSRFED